MEYTENNLKTITNSQFRIIGLADGQKWEFTTKRINIVDKNGFIVKGFNKNKIRFASDGKIVTLSPFLD